MKIERKRYVVMRNNRTEIWCGLAQNYKFKKIDEIGETPIKTYRTNNQAMSCSSWDRDFEVVEVAETFTSTDHQAGKEGKWIDGLCDGKHRTICSNCGSIIPTDTQVDFLDENDNRFCYWCGQKMNTQ